METNERIIPFPEEQPLVNAEQVAAAYDCHVQTVYRMAADRELPVVMVGRKMMFSTAEIRRRLGLELAPAAAS